MAKQFTLGKNERLKSRKLIEQLFSEGKKFSENPFRVFYMMKGIPGSVLQLGVGVSGKTFKKAVDRNRVKRLVKEAWRMQKKILHDRLKEQEMQLAVFIIYTGKELPLFKEVYDKTGRILDKLNNMTGSKK